MLAAHTQETPPNARAAWHAAPRSLGSCGHPCAGEMAVSDAATVSGDPPPKPRRIIGGHRPTPAPAPLQAPLAWTLAAAASIAASSAFYTYIWNWPSHFARGPAGGRDPCSVMAALSVALKALQFACVLRCTDAAAVWALAPWQLAASLLLVAAGQHLNARVFALLGMEGVYYGARFGKRIPWQSAWPYSHLRDPQYVGCLLTLAGAAAVMPAELAAWWAANVRLAAGRARGGAAGARGADARGAGGRAGRVASASECRFTTRPHAPHCVSAIPAPQYLFLIYMEAQPPSERHESPKGV